jgi:hypothetical protein
MTSPTRPFRIEVTPRRVEELRRLADNAEESAQRALSPGGSAVYEGGYAQGVRDALRWLAGGEPTDDLRETLAP